MFDANALFAFVFGLFLGLAIWKFGNPVILDHIVFPPTSLAEWWADAWPPHWSNWVLLPLVLAGAALVFCRGPRWPGTRWLWPLPLLWFIWQLCSTAYTAEDNPTATTLYHFAGCLACYLVFTRLPRWPGTRWLWLLPLLWFGWQLLSAMHTVDAFLTTTTLWQLGGCVACYFVGALVLGRERALRWLLVGVLAAFTFCLVRAADQRLFEFSESRKLLLEGGRTGWTNFPPELFLEMKREGTIINTNGVDVANPAVLARITKGRVMGTLVYPNALAGVILLLFPVSLALAFNIPGN